MSSAFALPLDVQSDVRDLHSAVRIRSQASLAYFARSVRGLRMLRIERLDALQAGTVEPSEFERKLLASWTEFKASGDFLP